MEGINPKKNEREVIEARPLADKARYLLRVALLAAMTSGGAAAREITPQDEHQADLRDERAVGKIQRHYGSDNIHWVSQEETNESVDAYIELASKFLNELTRVAEAYQKDRAGFEKSLEPVGDMDAIADERLRREHAHTLVMKIFEDVKVIDKAFPPESSILDVPYKKDAHVRNRVLKTIDNVRELFDESKIPVTTREAAFLELHRQGK